MIETRKDFLTDLGLPEANYSGLEAFVKGDHKYIRDLRVNLKTTLDSQNLGGKKNAYMIALAVAINEKSAPLVNSFTALAQKEGATEAEIAEIHACVSLLASLNVFYRFKHFAENKHYDTLQAGIKMTIMARPVLGKLFFETVALVVSAVNGCEICVNNHEKSIRSEGGSQEMIFDSIRLGAIVKGASVAMSDHSVIAVAEN